MTATCRPGLPIVVRFLVRSRVRPAAAPESTWIAASRSGVAPAAAPGAELGVGAGGDVAVVVADGAAAALGVSGAIAFRLVCVSPMPLSAAGGGGAALAGFLMIIVFSKSAAVAAVGASLKYLSLCLPISTTSLFCRKCFFTGLPFTIVPLVLPRSSMNESLRMVMMAACSPLTARLSIGMSLWGFLPMRVRSLVSWYSLSTCPSTLRVSLAIVVVLVLPEKCLQPREPASRHSKWLGDPDEHPRNAVASAVVVRRLDQLLHREVGMCLQRDEGETDLLVLDHVRQPVGAQEIGVVGLGLVDGHLGLDRGIDAERARPQALVLRELRPSRGDETGVELLLEERVVARHLLHGLAPQAIQARVADVGDGQEIVVEERHHERRAHSRALGIVLRRGVDGAVGTADMFLDELLGKSLGVVAAQVRDLAHVPRLLQSVGDERGGHAARDLARVVAAHAVGEDEETHLGARFDAVFVVVADPARIREARRLERLRKAHGRAPAARRGPASRWPVRSPSRRKCSCSLILSSCRQQTRKISDFIIT